MTKRINYLFLAVVVYFAAIVFYSFKSEQGGIWGLYQYTVTTYAICVLFLGMMKRNKTELDKSFLISIVLIRVFNWLCYLVWYISGCSEQNQPYFFCIIVAVCMFLGVIINKKLSWK